MRFQVSYIFKTYGKTNNKYLKSHDSKQKSKYIIDLDANSLYAYAISKYFPTIGFKWTDPKDFHSNKYSSNCWKGCVLEVDLDYRKNWSIRSK